MNLGRESEVLEFKKSTSELKEAMNDICSMLNKHGHGKLLIGVKPDGDVIGQQISESSLNDVAAHIKHAIRPMIYPEIKEKKIEGKTIIEINFEGHEGLYSSYGRYYKRVFDRAEELTPDELIDVISNKDFSSRWEEHETSVGIKAVDKEALRSFYDRSVACGRLEAMDAYDPRDLLMSLGLLRNDRLTNAGYHLFANKQPVVLKMAVYMTDERINYTDINRIHDNIYNLIDAAVSYIVRHIDWRVEFKGPSRSRVEIPEIPIDAIREIVVNSFAHANYRNDTEHQIVITPTRVEIYNPGDFPLNYKPEDFVTTRVRSIARNKKILDVLYRSKNVEIQGGGFRKVYKLCGDAGVSVTYRFNDHGFSFAFLRRNNDRSDKATEAENSSGNKIDLNKTEKEVLRLLKENPRITRDEIAEVINKTVRTIQRILNNLVENNIVTRIGSKKAGEWKISSPY